VDFPPAFSGSWISTSTFGYDFTSNGWVWDAKVREVAESASLTFRQEGDEIKVDVKQKKNGVGFTATGSVKIDPDKNILNISIPLVDYAGTAASWLPSTNAKCISGNKNDWYFVSHSGSNLSNIDTQGLWLGVVANSVVGGDTKDEVLIYHFLKK
jgi:hypothetical protein